MVDGDGIVLRRLEVGDHAKGMMELLGQLTDASGVDAAMFAARAAELAADPRTTMVVAEDTATGRIVGTAKLLVELKFTRRCGMVRAPSLLRRWALPRAPCGGMADSCAPHLSVATSRMWLSTRACEGRLGKRVVDECVKVAKEAGCYKGAMPVCARSPSERSSRSHHRRTCVRCALGS